MTSIRRFYFVRCNDGEVLADASLTTLAFLLLTRRIDIDTPIFDQKSKVAFFPDQHPWLTKKLATLGEGPLLQEQGKQAKEMAHSLTRLTERGQLLVAITAVAIASLVMILSITLD